MKRTLVEVSCGLFALVAMVSFHHQIARLEIRSKDVQQLKQRIESIDAVVAAADDQQQLQELQELRQQVLVQMEQRMHGLEQQLQQATAGSTLAMSLQSDLQRAQTEVKNFRSQMASDFERTKALVDAYISEVRTKERDASLRMHETQDALATLAGRLYRDPMELTRTMLQPTVQLNGDDTVGSGTLVWSDVNPKSGKVESYVLTSYHVVRNILADTPRAAKEGFKVTVYLPGEKVDVKGMMIAGNAKIDAAMVQLQTDRRFTAVANVLPRDEAASIKVWDAICAVGCPLGNDPVPTHGEVSSLRNELNGANYWMINAPTYFGNSGGGIYRCDTRQLIGVFSKIYTHGKGNPVVIPHMGLCTPISSIYEWLAGEELDHLLQSNSVKRADLPNLAAPPR